MGARGWPVPWGAVPYQGHRKHSCAKELPLHLSLLENSLKMGVSLSCHSVPVSVRRQANELWLARGTVRPFASEFVQKRENSPQVPLMQQPSPL